MARYDHGDVTRQRVQPIFKLADPGEVELPIDASGGAEPGAAVRLLGELRHAIDHGDLTVFYQPKYDPPALLP